LAGESVDSSVEGSVVVLAPGHTVALLVLRDGLLVEDAGDLSDLVLGEVGSRDAAWYFAGWLPAAFDAATVVLSEWDGASENVTLVTLRVAHFIASILIDLASDFTVFWLFQFFVAPIHRVFWITSWKRVVFNFWGPVSLVISASKHVGMVTGVALVAGDGANIHAEHVLAVNTPIEWVLEFRT
jgi:hypothetical protein